MFETPALLESFILPICSEVLGDSGVAGSSGFVGSLGCVGFSGIVGSSGFVNYSFYISSTRLYSKLSTSTPKRWLKSSYSDNHCLFESYSKFR